MSSKLLRILFPRGKEEPGDRTQLKRIQKALGYHFKDHGHLTLALTHRSFTSPTHDAKITDNERLEFLGDAVLNTCVTDYLYHRFPSTREGRLSKMKSLIVSRKILGEVAESIDLGRFLFLGQSEEDSGGRNKRSILSNAFEAVLGAVYLDGGMDEARKMLNRLLMPRVDGFLNEKSNINYKSRILERAQGDGFGAPHYRILSATGPDHAKTFKVRIEIAGVAMGEGEGSNKKTAEQRAAECAVRAYSTEKIREHKERKVNDELVSD